MDRLVEMTCFARAVETGSFAAAGKALTMSAQLVGKHVSSLEDRLGAQLLVRTTRRHHLTEVGRAFYDRCCVVLKEAEAAEAAVTELTSMARGQLVLSAPSTFGTLRLMPFLTDYLTRHPAVQVKLVLTDRTVDVVGEGFDAVVRIGPLDDSSLVVRRLAPLRLGAFAAPRYLGGRRRPVVPGDLREHECLIYEYWYKPPLTEWTFEKDGVEQTVAVSGRLQTNDGRAVIEAALEGQGIVLQDEELVRHHVAAGRLVHLLADHRGPARDLRVVYPPHRRMTPKLRGFLDALVAHFPPPDRRY